MNQPAETEPLGNCPNCHAPLHGTYCAQCGQNQRGLDRVFFTLVAEAFENVFSFDSRTAKTLFAILLRPGYLTAEYFAGRRARYIPPLRLYLVTSVLFFLFLSLQTRTADFGPLNIQVDNDTSASSEIAEPAVSTEENTQVADDLKEARKVIGEALKRRAERENAGGATPVEDTETTEGSELTTSEAAATEDDDHINVDLNFSGMTPEENAALNQRLETQITKFRDLAIEDPGELLDRLLEIAPPVMFVLMPLFALLIKIFYLGSGRFYSQHLILAVHNHSFIYLALLLEGLLDLIATIPGVSVVADILMLWIPIYMYLSLKKVYRQGYFKTLIKFVMLGISYLLLFFSAFAASIIGSVLTL